MPKFTDMAAGQLFHKLVKGSRLEQESPLDILPELVMHVAEGCNLGCTYCFADAGQYGRDVAKWMDPGKAGAYVRSMVRRYHGVGRVKFFGGEPFMNVKAIRATIDAFKSLVAEGHLESEPQYGAVSNMTIVTPQVISLINDNDFGVTGSIDGPPDVHDSFRVYKNGSGSFSVVDKGIKRLRAETGEPSCLEVVYGPEHLRRGYSIVDIHEYLLERYGVEDILIHGMNIEDSVAHIPGWDEYNARTRDLFEEYYRYLVANVDVPTNARAIRQLLYELTRKRRSDHHCGLGVYTQTVSADGDLYPCYTLLDKEEWVMDRRVDEPIWKRDRHDRIQLKLITNRKTTNPICSKCDVMPICKACPGAMLSAGGAIDAPLANHCRQLIGSTEGLLSAILATRQTPDKWSLFTGLLGGGEQEVGQVCA